MHINFTEYSSDDATIARALIRKVLADISENSSIVSQFNVRINELAVPVLQGLILNLTVVAAHQQGLNANNPVVNFLAMQILKDLVTLNLIYNEFQAGLAQNINIDVVHQRIIDEIRRTAQSTNHNLAVADNPSFIAKTAAANMIRRVIDSGFRSERPFDYIQQAMQLAYSLDPAVEATAPAAAAAAHVEPAEHEEAEAQHRGGDRPHSKRSRSGG